MSHAASIVQWISWPTMTIKSIGLHTTEVKYMYVLPVWTSMYHVLVARQWETSYET